MSHNNTLTNAKKETLLTHQIALLFWMNSCSYFEGNPAFIQRVFFQKRTVMLARGTIWLCCWAFPWARGTRGYLHMNVRGRDRIRNNELDGTDWTSCWFHTDYFITECLFSIRLTSFQSRHFQLSIDITPMSVCWVFAELQFILVTYFEEQLAEMEKTERILFVFFFFFQNHKVLLYSWVYTKKIDTSKFQLMYNTYLYDQNRQSIFNVFCTGLKKNELVSPAIQPSPY